MTNEYYRKELMKLRMIFAADSNNITVSSDYIVEKIDKILEGTPIGIHPGLKKYVYDRMLKENCIPLVSVLQNIDPTKFTEKEYNIIESYINQEHREELESVRKQK